MEPQSEQHRRTVAEVTDYLHRARSVVLDVFGGELGREQSMAAIHLAAAMVQADAALRLADANDRLAAAMEARKES